ncbi:hypothetical protein BD779DRAFT_1807953 [Infundibulicybe gibba]|nr:hypothetical protein BD779DRAFT_1807953 [Infundibulicybe gibba]
MTTILSLPLPLLLLVHLHLLSYPHAAKPEYDHALFDPRVRGLRDRIRSMEDVCYFLVGQIAGPALRTILPVYPCLQPTETLAFRTSLAKYLEALRHQAIFGKDPSMVQAMWWKDVVVRKSILEECAGINTVRQPDPHIYATHLTMPSQSALNGASALSSLHIAPTSSAHSAIKFSLHPTLLPLRPPQHSRLRALAESHARDARGTWPGPALEFTLHLAGLSTPHPSDTLHRRRKHSLLQKYPSAPPVAAAHHPTHIRALKKRIFASASASAGKKGASVERAADAGSRPAAVFAVQVDAMTRTQHAMRDALTSLRTAHAQAQRRIHLHPRANALDLWHPALPTGVDFQSAPTPDLLAEISPPHPEAELESRIERIRQSLSGYDEPKIEQEPEQEPEPEHMRVWTPPPANTSAPKRKPASKSKPTALPRPAAAVEKKTGAPRRSIRRSLAAARHPVRPRGRDSEEIWKLVQSAQDTDRRESAEGGYTPRGTRLYTHGHGRTPGAAARGAGGACPVELSEPGVQLPEAGEDDRSLDDDDDDVMDGWDGEEGRSVTLREILLGAGEPAFDLLDARVDEADEEGDGSFEWA